MSKNNRSDEHLNVYKIVLFNDTWKIIVNFGVICEKKHFE